MDTFHRRYDARARSRGPSASSRRVLARRLGHGRNALARSQSHHPPLRPPKSGRRRGPKVTHAEEGG
eukprot:1065903-Prymnesium_polylepis.1